jgi:hypothetical protein
LITFVDAPGCSYGLAILQNEFAGRNIASGEAVARRDSGSHANNSIVRKRHCETRLGLFLDNRQIVSWINNDRVFGYRR